MRNLLKLAAVAGVLAVSSVPQAHATYSVDVTYIGLPSSYQYLTEAKADAQYGNTAACVAKNPNFTKHFNVQLSSGWWMHVLFGAGAGTDTVKAQMNDAWRYGHDVNYCVVGAPTDELQTFYGTVLRVIESK